MTSNTSKRAAGKAFRNRTRNPAPVRGLRRARTGLLASTALVAASLAASGALAQSFPAGAGAIVVTGGGATTNNAGASGGFQNIGGTSFLITDVTISNTTGLPDAHAVNISRSTLSATGDGVQLSGTNSLTAATGGTALNYVSTGGNNTDFLFEGTLNAAGLNGISISTLGDLTQGGSGTLILTAQTPGSGTGLAMSAAGSIAGSGLTGSVTVTNFATGISLNATNGSVDFRTGAGGAITGATTGVTAQANTGVTLNIGSSISATGTGINAATTSGNASVTATGSIVASTGINAGSAGGVSVTTSGLGAINATSAGNGTGIAASSSAGAGGVTVNVGAAIGERPLSVGAFSPRPVDPPRGLSTSPPMPRSARPGEPSMLPVSSASRQARSMSMPT